MKLLHSLAFGVALAAGAASAQAQNVITRQVTQEPVETTVTEGPAGTVVTKRPLAPAPAPAIGAVRVAPAVAPPYDPFYAPPATVEIVEPAPAATATYVDETVGIAQRPRIVNRTFARTPTARRPAPAARVVRYERDVTTGSGARAVQRSAIRSTTVRRTTVRRTVATRSAPLVLAPAERRVIYRTVVQQQVVPAAPDYPAYPDYPAARTVVVPATTGTGYAVATPSYDVPAVQEVYDYDDTPPIYAPRSVAPAIYPVGARLPATIALSPVPETLAVQMPAIRAYRTVLISNRVLLVDPVTYTVVADVTP